MNYQLGLIGHPIKHSLSPWIHKQFLTKAELEGDYRLFDISPAKSFASQMDDLRDINLNGFNVTVPFKQKIIPFLNEVDPEAEGIGSVNTVVNRDGKWIGYNTDGKGYIRSIKQQYPEPFTNKDKRIVIVGAGGAARGIYAALVGEGFKFIDIANRTTESAEKIAKLRSATTFTEILTLGEIEQQLSQYDIIIQTTSVGMKPNEDQLVISLEKLNNNSIVSEIIYQPIMTRFLQQAEAKGAQIHFGHTMLLYQALYAFELWTNKHIIIDNMETELHQILKGR